VGCRGDQTTDEILEGTRPVLYRPKAACCERYCSRFGVSKDLSLPEPHRVMNLVLLMPSSTVHVPDAEFARVDPPLQSGDLAAKPANGTTLTSSG